MCRVDGIVHIRRGEVGTLAEKFQEHRESFRGVVVDGEAICKRCVRNLLILMLCTSDLIKSWGLLTVMKNLKLKMNLLTLTLTVTRSENERATQTHTIQMRRPKS